MAVFVLILPLMLGALLYTWQSYNYFFGLKRVGLCIAFVGYTIGNIGLIIDAYEQG